MVAEFAHQMVKLWNMKSQALLKIEKDLYEITQ